MTLEKSLVPAFCDGTIDSLSDEHVDLLLNHDSTELKRHSSYRRSWSPPT
jgi:hypothetical protein